MSFKVFILGNKIECSSAKEAVELLRAAKAGLAAEPKAEPSDFNEVFMGTHDQPPPRALLPERKPVARGPEVSSPDDILRSYWNKPSPAKTPSPAEKATRISIQRRILSLDAGSKTLLSFLMWLVENPGGKRSSEFTKCMGKASDPGGRGIAGTIRCLNVKLRKSGLQQHDVVTRSSKTMGRQTKIHWHAGPKIDEALRLITGGGYEEVLEVLTSPKPQLLPKVAGPPMDKGAEIRLRERLESMSSPLLRGLQFLLWLRDRVTGGTSKEFMREPPIVGASVGKDSRGISAVVGSLRAELEKLSFPIEHAFSSLGGGSAEGEGGKVSRWVPGQRIDDAIRRLTGADPEALSCLSRWKTRG